MPLSTGDTAPGFALPASPGEIVDVGARIGARPIVLLFFPLAFSSVCTEELCAVRDDWSSWTKLDAEVYGISIDSPFVTRKFREELGLPFPLLSDFNHDVGAAYGVLYEDYFGLRGVARRAAFVVGNDGRIAYAWVSERDDVLPDFEAVRDSVRAADHHRGWPGRPPAPILPKVPEVRAIPTTTEGPHVTTIRAGWWTRERYPSGAHVPRLA